MASSSPSPAEVSATTTCGPQVERQQAAAGSVDWTEVEVHPPPDVRLSDGPRSSLVSTPGAASATAASIRSQTGAGSGASSPGSTAAVQARTPVPIGACAV